MKAILVVDIPDDYKEYGNGDWYVVGDDLRIVYADYGSLRQYKYIEDDIAELKPMPERKCEASAIKRKVRDLRFESGFCEETLGKKIDEYAKGFNACINELLGGNE